MPNQHLASCQLINSHTENQKGDVIFFLHCTGVPGTWHAMDTASTAPHAHTPNVCRCNQEGYIQLYPSNNHKLWRLFGDHADACHAFPLGFLENGERINTHTAAPTRMGLSLGVEGKGQINMAPRIARCHHRSGTRNVFAIYSYTWHETRRRGDECTRVHHQSSVIKQRIKFDRRG